MKDRNKDGLVPGQIIPFDVLKRLERQARAKKAEPVETGIGTDSGDQFSDEQLRAAIKAATGRAPHWKCSRETLIEQFNALNAE